MVTFYKNGQDFYNENKNIINENEIQTPFLKLNALSIENLFFFSIIYHSFSFH